MNGEDVPMITDLVTAIRHVESSPVVVLAPHAGRVIPPEHRDAFTLSDAALEHEHDLMVDHYTDQLAHMLVGRIGASAVINALSRFVVDVERFPDQREEMNQVGMGVLYTHGSHRQPIRDLDRVDVTPLMQFFHHYADTVTDVVSEVLQHHNEALIIDLHSFPQISLPYELHHEDRRPELCVGHEEPHAPTGFLARLREELSGWDIEDNEPFRGSYVPLKFFGSDNRVSSVMLEIRRDTYLQEPAGKPVLDRLQELSTAISRALDGLV